MKKQFVIAALLTGIVAAPTYAQTAKPKPAMPAAVRFTKAGETWGVVLAERRTLARAIAESRLSDVHDAAFALRDAVVTLPYKSNGLPKARAAVLSEKVASVAALADALHTAADGQDISRTKIALAKLARSLDAIAGLFPANALPTGDAKPLTAADKVLFLMPGGAYTQAEILANGNTSPVAKYAGVIPAHDTKASRGEPVCPISETKPNPALAWTIGGKSYTFCCTPCIGEFVTKAKRALGEIKTPEACVKP